MQPNIRTLLQKFAGALYALPKELLADGVHDQKRLETLVREFHDGLCTQYILDYDVLNYKDVVSTCLTKLYLRFPTLFRAVLENHIEDRIERLVSNNISIEGNNIKYTVALGNNHILPAHKNQLKLYN